MPPERAVEFDIPLQPNTEIPFARGPRLSFAQVEALRGMLRELLQGGLIRASKSPFSAPLLMVAKPDGSWRLVVDYRKLNAISVKDRYPLPNPQAIFDQMAGSSVFSVLDLRWGYYQVRINEADAYKTAFSTPIGSFEWMVMPMGTSNSGPTFQKLMDQIFRDLDFVAAYLDDIIIHSKSQEEHLEHLHIVFDRLQAHKLLCRLTKVQLFQSSVRFLSFHISGEGDRKSVV